MPKTWVKHPTARTTARMHPRTGQAPTAPQAGKPGTQIPKTSKHPNQADLASNPTPPKGAGLKTGTGVVPKTGGGGGIGKGIGLGALGLAGLVLLIGGRGGGAGSVYKGKDPKSLTQTIW